MTSYLVIEEMMLNNYCREKVDKQIDPLVLKNDILNAEKTVTSQTKKIQELKLFISKLKGTTLV